MTLEARSLAVLRSSANLDFPSQPHQSHTSTRPMDISRHKSFLLHIGTQGTYNYTQQKVNETENMLFMTGKIAMDDLKKTYLGM